MSYLLVIHHDRLWYPGGQLPRSEALDTTALRQRPIGEWQGQAAYLVTGYEPPAEELVSIRDFMASDEALFLLAGRARHLAHFEATHQYCGCCGARNHPEDTLGALRCSRCGHTVWPRIAPCVIVAIRRGHQVLLAQHRRHTDNLYTVLAGFVEPGEAVEMAVMREVREETGLAIHQIRYVASQPWPFPDSLMLAFIADYQEGEIQCDGHELTAAGWYDATQLPSIPRRGTIARQLIELALGQDIPDQ